MKISGILGNKNWVAINLQLAQKLGINAAFLFSHLCGLFESCENRGEIIEFEGKKFFPATIKDVENCAVLTRTEQDTAIKNLISNGLITKKIMAIPAKRYFAISETPFIGTF